MKTALDQLNRGSLPAAIQAFSKILESHSELDEVRRNLAFAFFANNQFQAATKEYEKLVRADPGDAGFRVNLGMSLREASLLDRALLDRAREELEEAVHLNPESAQAHYQLGLVWLAQKDTTRAMEQFHHARRIDPSLRPPGAPPDHR